MSSPSPPDSEQRINGVYLGEVERMFEILSARVLTVMEAHRYAEEHARMYNRIGRNNLTEGLSHLARLAEDAAELSKEEQRDQLTHFEDHPRGRFPIRQTDYSCECQPTAHRGTAQLPSPLSP